MISSRLVKFEDYQDMETTDDIQGTPMSEEKIHETFIRMMKRNVVTTDVETIDKGDFVVIDLTGDKEFLNKKNLMLTVGLGMFNSDFENEIIGMKKDEIKTIYIHDNTVIVEVKSVKRRSLAKVTDELIASLGIDGINTVYDYREYLINNDLKYQMIRNVSKKAIDEKIIKEGFTIVYFYREECSPCEMMSDVLDELIFELPFINIIMINTTQEKKLSEECEISSVPTVHFYIDGKKVNDQVGFMDLENLREIIGELMY